MIYSMTMGAIGFPVRDLSALSYANPLRWSPRRLSAAFAVAVAVGYLIWSPTAPDLAAQTAWAHLVRRSGLVPVFARWYEGIGTGSYSLLSPWFMAVLGVRVVGALSAASAIVLGAELLKATRRPRLGIAMFALCNATDLLCGRITFAMGLAIGTGAALALARKRTALATTLAVATCLTSPVAGVFLLVPAAALVLSDPSRRRVALFAAGGVVASLGLLHWAFPLSGYEPFTRELLIESLAIEIGAAVVPVGRFVRSTALLGAAAIIITYFVHTPLGGNVARLPVLIMPAAVVADVGLRRLGALVVAAILSIYPIAQAVSDISASYDGAAALPFTAGLAARLSNDPLAHSQRVEVVDSQTHWGATRLADAGISLSRGWLTQLDETDNPLFYGREPLNAVTYRAFLDRTGTGYVALERGAPLETGGQAEAALVRRGLPYLSPVWADEYWTLYRVANPHPLATGTASVVSTTDTGVLLYAEAPGWTHVDVNWSPFLKVDGGQVVRDGSQIWVNLDSAGLHNVRAVWPWASATPLPDAG
jgi:hypothetical protein